MLKSSKETLELIAKNNSEIITGIDLSPSHQGENVFMGLGLLSKDTVSKGLGVGVLPMLCLAAQFQKELPSASISVLVADIHAIEETESKLDLEITTVADEIVFWASVVLRNLGSTASIFRASTHPHFQFSSQGGYASRQTQDVLIAHQQLDCGLKIGWQSKRNGVRDEKFFDQLTKLERKNELQDLSFLRTQEGLSQQIWKGEHQAIPPYFGEANLSLGKPINIKETASSKQMHNWLARIGRTLGTTLGIKTKTLDLLQEFVNDVYTSIY